MIAVLGACLGCSSGEPEKTRTPTPLDLSKAGRISGTVRFEGTAPEQTVLNMASDRQCASQHEGTIYAGDVLVQDGKVQNAIVYIKEGLGDRVFTVPQNPVVIDQAGCLFVPRVTAAQVQQPIKFLNSDALLHNVRGKPGQSSGWNFSLSVKGASRTVYVGKEEPAIEIRCDVHPWMTAYLGVFDHPYFAVTGADGSFELRDVPPGDYAVAVWHERLGRQTAEVSLAEKGSASVQFVLRAE